MTDETAPVDQDVDATADGVQQAGVDDWKTRAEKAEADAAKHRALRKQAEKERDDLKQKTKNQQDEDYKSLWQQEQEAKNKLMARVKGAAVQSAVTAQLTKSGVLPDAIEAAAKLVDEGLIEWDEDSGVDGASITAAVAKLKSQFGFMFEKKVAKTEPKNPADGSSSDASEIRRSDFNKLDPVKRMQVVQKGIKVVD